MSEHRWKNCEARNSNCEARNSKKYEQRVQFNSQKARSSGANSTPTFVIVNSSGDQQQIRGAQPYSVFEKVIESLL